MPAQREELQVLTERREERTIGNELAHGLPKPPPSVAAPGGFSISENEEEGLGVHDDRASRDDEVGVRDSSVSLPRVREAQKWMSNTGVSSSEETDGVDGKTAAIMQERSRKGIGTLHLTTVFQIAFEAVTTFFVLGLGITAVVLIVEFQNELLTTARLHAAVHYMDMCRFRLLSFIFLQYAGYDWTRTLVQSGTLPAYGGRAFVAPNGTVLQAQGFQEYANTLSGNFRYSSSRSMSVVKGSTLETWELENPDPRPFSIPIVEDSIHDRVHAHPGSHASHDEDNRAPIAGDGGFSALFNASCVLRIFQQAPLNRSCLFRFPVDRDLSAPVFGGCSSPATRSNPALGAWVQAANSTRAPTSRWIWETDHDPNKHVRFVLNDQGVSMAYRIDWPNSTEYSLFNLALPEAALGIILKSTRDSFGDEYSVLAIMRKSDGTVVGQAGMSIDTAHPKLHDTPAFNDHDWSISEDVIDSIVPFYTHDSFRAWARSVNHADSDWIIVVGFDDRDIWQQYAFLSALWTVVGAMIAVVLARMLAAVWTFYRMFRSAKELRILQERSMAGELQAQEAKKSAEESNDAKSRFVSVMSHEIRNPLAVVVLNAELLADQLAGQPDYIEYVDGMTQSCKVLLTIVNDVLDLTKIESGAMTLERKPLSLLDVVENVVLAIGSNASSKSIELGYELCTACPRVVVGDFVRLHQILYNFMSNAVKFTQEGSVFIHVGFLPVDDQARLTFDVIDTGPGIPRHKLQQLFREFSQLDQSTTRKHGGSGLGLFICKQLAGLMGGEVSAKSTLGKGSTFTLQVTLPILDDSPAQRPLPKEIRMIMQKRRFGIVSISKQYQWQASSMLRAMCGEQGAEIMVFSSPRAAVASWEAEKSGMVLVVDAQLGKDVSALIDSEDFDPLDLSTSLKTLLREEQVCMIFGSAGVLTRDEHEALLAQGWTFGLSRPLRYQLFCDAMIKHASGGKFCVDDLPIFRGRSETGGRLTPISASQKSSPISSQDNDKIEALVAAAKPSVLLVDDNRLMQRLISKLMEKLGFLVTLASDGEEAVREYKKGARKRDGASVFALVLMDCEMPVMDGFEATGQIRKYEAKHSLERVPIIACTANAMADDRQHCIAAGMDNVLTKPLRVSQLGEIVDTYVGNLE